METIWKKPTVQPERAPRGEAVAHYTNALRALVLLLPVQAEKRDLRGKASMKVVTLCGSMRFFREMQNIAVELETKYDYCAIAPTGGTKEEMDNTAIEKLSKAHYKKIDMADAVYIVNIGGYIGEAFREELRYAQMNNKEIIFHEAK